MSQAARDLRITYAEFCDLAPADDRRYELLDGRVIAMNQPSPRHARLTASLIVTLTSALAGRCNVLGPVGVYCAKTDEGFGPDIVVTCERPQLDPVKGRAIVNPRAIIEILSPTTETIDKGVKLRRYRTLESLQEYVLVSQNERLVQIYRRGQTGWLWQDVTSGTFDICEAPISVTDIYAGIEEIPSVT